ncbi:MAG: hypothetical protein AABN95_03715 [Acidobacteriota bacterium]
MSNQSAPNQSANAPATNSVAGRADAGKLSTEALQVLIDQIATFNAFVIPDGTSPSCAIRAQGGGGIVGLKCCERVHRFDIELEVPSDSGVRTANVLGEAVGRVDLRWMFIPDSFAARPDLEPPPTTLDQSRSQRFAMQEMTFTFAEGEGFRSFGTGRTFPMSVNGQPKLIAVAIGNLTQGFGKFSGHEGNFTICGEVSQDGGFIGHIIARVLDEHGNLRTREALPPPSAIVARPDLDFTYLMWLAQKGKGPEQENRPSLTPDGQLRGLNIPMELKRGRSTFTAGGSAGFRAQELSVGEVIGLEVGFGRGSGGTQDGTPLNPFLFEGVARYSLDDREKRTVGAVTTNVLEGRRFDYRLAAAPGEVAWRFGFFGPVVYGSGCFEGVSGIFYGASNSIFKPPPGAHIITHCYFARLHDPNGKLRATSGRSGP